MTEQTIKRAEQKAKAIDLLGGECVQCGNDGTSGLITERLEFDHINREREDIQHTLAYLWGHSWNKILLELKKCQLLCGHCHVTKSHIERGHDITHRHGLHSTYTVGKCRCSKCRTANTAYIRKYRLGIA